MNIYIFIDYDNLQEEHKEEGILSIIQKVLSKISFNAENKAENKIDVEVRIYGGWYEDEQMTRKAQDLSATIQDIFPKMLKLPENRTHIFNIKTALAFALLQEPDRHIFNTFRKKGNLKNIRVENQQNVNCENNDCVLPKIKKLIRTGKCFKLGCDKDNLVYRYEQKIIDTMLSSDMIYAADILADIIILISGDDDFLPPIRAALLKSKKVFRFLPKKSNQYRPFSYENDRELSLTELEL
jgi:uncharacterized LabA/DUF88 family protein